MQTAVFKLSGLQLIQMGPAIDHRAEECGWEIHSPALAARLQSGQQLHSLQ